MIHQTLLVRTAKGLDGSLPVAFAGEPRIQGYAIRDEESPSWRGVERLRHVHQLYSLSDGRYTGRATVPLLWDTATRRIVSNGSARIVRALEAVGGTDRRTLVARHLAPAIDVLNRRIHERLANAVYRVGLAQRQEAYDEAIDEVFATLTAAVAARPAIAPVWPRHFGTM